MQAFVPNSRTKAFTLIEMLTVIAIIAILAAMLMPVLHQGQARAQRIWCESNLKQIGLAYHTFANDHSGKFPIEVSTNDGGSMEYIQNGLSSGGWFYTVYRTFQTLSNELVKPELVICSTDILRKEAPSFAALQNTNVSYFVGANGTFDKPETILAGDRNLANDMFQIPTILQAGPGYKLHWTRELHQYQGNMAFADGHVEEWNNGRMANLESKMDDVENLLLPSAVQLMTWVPRIPAQPPLVPVAAAPAAAVPEVDASPVSPADSGGGMSDQDEHITKVVQHTFEWIYLLLLLMMLLYLTYKTRKWMHQREARERARQRSRWSVDIDEPCD